MSTHPTRVVETTWTVDGEDVVAVSLRDADSSEDDPVALLESVLGCSRLEAEHAFRVIVEDGEFVTSVVDDIDTLP